MIPNDRRVEGFTFVENNTTTVKLPRGFMERGLLITGSGTDTISVIGTAVRARGTPIRRIQLIADNGKVLHSVVPSDLIREMELYEQMSLAALVSPLPNITVAAHAFSFAIPLMFSEPFAALGNITALPTWAYQDLTLSVDWGGHAQLAVGGTGVVTMQSLGLTMLGLDEDWKSMQGDPNTWARDMARSIRAYSLTAAPAVATEELSIELDRTSSIRSLIIVTEDANGQPTDGIINSISLLLNNIHLQFSRVPGAAIKAANSKLFGVAPLTGVYVLEFADDKDIAQILFAEQLSDLRLRLNVTAVAGTIRVYQKRLAPGLAAAA